MEASRATPELRPLSLGEILDAGFKVYRSHFKTLCLCVLVVVVPVTILGTLIQASTSENAFNPSAQTASSADGAAIAGLVVSGLLQGLLALLATAACVRAVAAAYLGHKVTWQESLRFAFRKLLPLIALAILTGLLTALGLIALLIGAVFVFVRLAVGTPVMLVEDAGVTDSMSRSWNLVKGNWWRCFGVYLIISILAGILAALIQGLLIAPIFANSDSELLGASLTTLGGIISATITVPLQAAVLTILYFDLRVRKEGFDLALLSEGVGGPARPTSPSGPDDVARSSGLGGEPASSGGFSSPSSGGFSAPPPSTSGDPLAPPPEERDRP